MSSAVAEVPTLQAQTEILPEGTVKPAAGVWTQPMPPTKDEKVEFFRREGFLVPRAPIHGIAGVLEEIGAMLEDEAIEFRAAVLGEFGDFFGAGQRLADRAGF